MRAILTSLLITFLSVSCAQKELRLDTSTVQPLAELAPAKPAYSLRGKLQIMGFTDDREDQTGIGFARTGIFNWRTPITIDTPVEAYMRNKFISRLMAGGIDTLGDGKYAAKGSIRKLWITEMADGLPAEYSICEGEVELKVTPKSGRGASYRSVVSASAKGTKNGLDSTDSYGRILETCVLMLVDKFISDRELQTLLAAE